MLISMAILMLDHNEMDRLNCFTRERCIDDLCGWCLENNQFLQYTRRCRLCMTFVPMEGGSLIFPLFTT
jgi:hypothetical protein